MLVKYNSWQCNLGDETEVENDNDSDDKEAEMAAEAQRDAELCAAAERVKVAAEQAAH
jgi:hypothetical protein